jgi:peptidoglycan/xylan/chitin deacetylase (PgdA/CDA1 family)
MTPALFERIIKDIKRRYRVVVLEEWLNEADKRDNNKGLATVLFDDGYKDNIQYAAPILEKHSCPASFYVVTDCISRNIPTWTYLMDHVLQQTRIATIAIDGKAVPVKLKSIDVSDKAMVKQIKPWMKQLPNTERVQVLNQIVQQCNDVAYPENKMMNWEDVRQLDSVGFHIGSHSHTHPMLAALEDEQEIFEELKTSAEIITAKTGKAPLTISYPIGSFDERVTRLSVRAGYRYGLAVEQRFFRFEKDGLMAIPRVELYQEPWWRVGMRISGLYQKAKQLW